MYKKSKLTELYVTAMEESENLGLSNKEVLQATTHQNMLTKLILESIDPLNQELFLEYIDVSNDIRKQQLKNSVEQGYKAGIMSANRELKADRKSYLPTKGLLKMFEHFRNETYYSASKPAMEMLSLIESWIYRRSNAVN